MNPNGGQYWTGAKSSGERTKRCADDLLEIEQARLRSQVCRDESLQKNWSFKFLWDPRGEKNKTAGAQVECAYFYQ